MTTFPFLDRSNELEKLRSFSGLKEPSLAILYGRRRCGKSRLLQQFSRDDDIYFLADKQDATLQRERLARDAARLIPGLDQVSYPSWESILSQIDLRSSAGLCLFKRQSKTAPFSERWENKLKIAAKNEPRFTRLSDKYDLR